ncbi:MAG: hypothetical protein MK101_09620 [Phycisphaerales bacterium]|nr:hypothetical protein [Phycisphaerales bacterium]
MPVRVGHWNTPLALILSALPALHLHADEQPSTLTQDVGPAVCEFVRTTMQTTEPQWHERLDRGYRWWPHWYRQDIIAEQAEKNFDIALSKVRIETVLLTDVRASKQLYENLSKLNAQATTSALIHDPETETVFLFSGVLAHEQNLEIAQQLAAMSTALQVSEAAMQASEFQKLLGGSPLESLPPGGQQRLTPDDMTNFLSSIAVPMGDRPSVYKGTACPRAKREVGHWSLLTNADADGLSAEFEWTPGADPTIAKIARGDADVTSETVLLRMSADERHKMLGNGMQVALLLPIHVPEEVGPSIANRLNLAERHASVVGHHWGAWTWVKGPPEIDPLDRLKAGASLEPSGTLMHVSFLPNAAAIPGIGSILFQTAAVRSKWAKRWIDAHTNLRLPAG